MDTYIIRIYRQEKENPSETVGVLEEIDSPTRQSFRGLDDLCALLTVCQQTKNGWKRGGCRDTEKTDNA